MWSCAHPNIGADTHSKLSRPARPGPATGNNVSQTQKYITLMQQGTGWQGDSLEHPLVPWVCPCVSMCVQVRTLRLIFASVAQHGHCKLHCPPGTPDYRHRPALRLWSKLFCQHNTRLILLNILRIAVFSFVFWSMEAWHGFPKPHHVTVLVSVCWVLVCLVCPAGSAGWVRLSSESPQSSAESGVEHQCRAPVTQPPAFCSDNNNNQQMWHSKRQHRPGYKVRLVIMLCSAYMSGDKTWCVVQHKTLLISPQLISRHIAHPTFLILRSLGATVARAGIFKRLRLGLNTHYSRDARVWLKIKVIVATVFSRVRWQMKMKKLM